ncbi:type I restriction-modification system subunit M, partial [Psittacicella hinzii]
MSSMEQRAELQRKIWQIADNVRGSIDGWDFKQYVLGTLFYRYISELIANYIGDDYHTWSDETVQKIFDQSVEMPENVKFIIASKGFFLFPSKLFCNIAKDAHRNSNLNVDLKEAFEQIEKYTNEYSEPVFKGLFSDFDVTSSRLGATAAEKNKRLAAILQGIADLNFGNFEESKIDLFGDAYEFLISNYAANAGKSGGEYFTPPQVSQLLARLAIHGQKNVNAIYDPACGSGSLLLQARKLLNKKELDKGYFGQEINPTTYNLARMNMLLHDVNYSQFNISLGDTLLKPVFNEYSQKPKIQAKNKPFDVIVSNPPYSVKWVGEDDPTLIGDERFAPAGVLAPKKNADFAFVLHALNYLSETGKASIVCFPGILYRVGPEQNIRKYLVDNNYVESIISLSDK